MSKRTRGAHRPQSRRPGQRGGAGGAPRRPATAQITRTPIVDDDTQAEEMALAMSAEARPLANVARGSRAKPTSLLAARAAEEYVYVAQDLRRIALVAVLLFGLLFAAWIALELMGFPGK